MLQKLNDCNEKIKELYSVYFENRKLYIQAEELSVNMNMYIAPLVEHRDAFDHLMRCFQKVDEGNDEYVKEIEKALDHELRAYYDIADYICINIRDYIANVLNSMRVKDIKKIWTEYESKKRELFDISMDIASIRNARRSSIESVYKYRDEVIPHLFRIYEDFIKKFETYIRGRIRL